MWKMIMLMTMAIAANNLSTGLLLLCKKRAQCRLLFVANQPQLPSAEVFDRRREKRRKSVGRISGGKI